ncbi:MAG: MotA/TolQ/ExbB proton channel family protein [Phycisphaerales bacterium]
MDFLEQVRQVVSAGGWVMFPLIVLSVLSVTLCVERIAFWARTHSKRSRSLVRAIAARLHEGNPGAALDLARQDNTVYGRFVESLLDRSRRPSEPAALEEIERLRPAIERFGTFLATTIAAAPLLGILGTVTGIIRSFNLLGGAGTVSDPTAVAAGIAEALFTTAFGLTVALVTLFPYAVFRAQSERCLGKLEALGAALADLPGSRTETPEPTDSNPSDPSKTELVTSPAS